MCRCCPNFSKQQGSSQLLARFQKYSSKMAQAAFLLAIAEGAESSHVWYCSLRGERPLPFSHLCTFLKLTQFVTNQTVKSSNAKRRRSRFMSQASNNHEIGFKIMQSTPAPKVVSFLSAWILKDQNTTVHIFNVLVFLGSELKRSLRKK